MPGVAEVYLASRFYARIGWGGLACAVACLLFGLRSPYAIIPGILCGLTSVFLFWLATRPRIVISDSQFTIGERAVAWREVLEINTGRFVSPLVLTLILTNNRRKRLIYPGEPEHIARLLYSLRKYSTLATFDGVSYRDYWSWSGLSEATGITMPTGPQARMVSQDDEEEIERLLQKLKSVGHLDSRSDSQKPHE